MAAATRVAEIEKLENESFTKGAQVEVSLEDPGFRGSWYTATVIRPVFKKTRKLLLEFHTLRADDKSSKPLRETVNIILARPLPPRESNRRRFHLSEEVDAFHNDGWWEGVVTAVRPAGDRCSVFFRCSREEIEFPAEDLRLHREWVYGKWVPPLENENNEDDNGGVVSGEQ